MLWRMSVIPGLEESNRRWAEGFEEQHLPIAPQLKLAVVACMDSRLDVFSVLGLQTFQREVLRKDKGLSPRPFTAPDAPTLQTAP